MSGFSRLLCLFILSLIALELPAQNFLWDLDFYSFFDNREYKAPYQNDQTFFGTRLSPEIGIGLKDHHQFKIGVSWLSEFGSEIKDSKVDMTVYYRYNSDKIKASFGSFPRRQLIQEFPAAMMYDSLLYFCPNINGALFQHISSKGHVEAYIDWKSKQTDLKREVFSIATNGQYHWGYGFAGWFVTLNHFARTNNPEDDTRVMDNIMANPFVGVDLSSLLFLNSFKLKTGMLVSANRDRGDNIWHRPAGFLGELTAEWRFLGLQNTLYVGGNQLTFYKQFGAALHNGDPFYQADLYNRLDLYGYFWRNKHVACKASVNFHFAGGKMQTQQQLLVRFNFDQSIIGKK